MLQYCTYLGMHVRSIPRDLFLVHLSCLWGLCMIIVGNFGTCLASDLKHCIIDDFIHVIPKRMLAISPKIVRSCLSDSSHALLNYEHFRPTQQSLYNTLTVHAQNESPPQHTRFSCVYYCPMQLELHRVIV